MAYEPLPIIEVAVPSLHLDLQNYRIPSRPEDEAAALDYLVSSEEVLKTAQLILRDGYFDNEVPIVIAEGDGYVVLEGNRRVSALKLLLEPELAGRHQERFERLLTRYATEVPNLPAAVRVLVAPDRTSALPHIARLHTTTPKKPWTPDQQATFYFSLLDGETTVDDIKADFPGVPVVRFMRMASVRRFLSGVRFDDPKLHQFAADGGLAMSAFEYAYRRPELASAMGIEFDENGFVQPADRSANEIGAALPEPQRRATEYMVDGFSKGRFNTRSAEFKVDSEPLRILAELLVGISAADAPADSDLAAESTAQAEADAGSAAEASATSEAGPQDGAPSPGEMDGASDNDHAVTGETQAGPSSEQDSSDQPAGADDEASSADESGSGSRRPNHPDTRPTLDLSGLDFEALPPNLELRFYDLDRIRYREFRFATAVHIRSLLELTIKVHFAASDERPSGTLGPVFKTFADEYGDEPAIRNVINKIRGGKESDPGSLRWFNAVGHDASFSVRPEDVLAAWNQVHPIFAWLLQPQS